MDPKTSKSKSNIIGKHYRRIKTMKNGRKQSKEKVDVMLNHSHSIRPINSPDQISDHVRGINDIAASGVYWRWPYGNCDCDLATQCGPLIEHVGQQLR